MNTIFDDEIRFIGDALRSITTDEFEHLVNDCTNTLLNNNKIIATGLGKNVPICEKFVGTMLSLGLQATFMHSNSAIHGDLGVVRDKDLVIMLTKSGETTESISLAKILLQRDVDLWLLTFNRHSSLSGIIGKKVVAKLEHEGDLWNIVPNNSSIVNLIILQNVCIRIAKKLDIKRDDFKKNHPGGNIGEILRCLN